jgi:aspartate aminotransferase
LTLSLSAFKLDHSLSARADWRNSMMEASISQHLDAVRAASGLFVEFLMKSTWTMRMGAEDICDFVVGNPHDMPLPAYVKAIRRASIPLNPSWFGYKTNEPTARDVAARSLRDRLGIPFESDDIFMTKGASSALVIALSTVLNPGDEVIFQSPPWFFYESMIAFTRGTPVRVKVDLATFDLDINAIVAAITPRTRAVIVNSPNNPTGKVYPPETLDRLAETLSAASEEYGRAIYLVSDESYNRILFDGRQFQSPTAHYPNSFLVYSYAKALLTPGQRLGYLALPPSMPDRERMRSAILATQCSGYGFPDAVLQHAMPDLEPLCIDLDQLQRRRDLMVDTLRQQGYDVRVPEGAWYLLPRSPLADDMTFIEMLAAEDVFVLPGSIVELPGYFRISLTASDAMVERSLPGFAAAIKAAQLRRVPLAAVR